MITILKKIIYPPTVIRMFLILLGFESLILAFYSPLSETPFVYAAYVLSAYALVVSVSWAAQIGKKVKNIRKGFIKRHGLVARYVSDHYFRVFVGLAMSLFINLGYAVLKAVDAVLSSSAWSGFVVVYYIALCLVRFYLMTKFLKDKEHDSEKEVRYYRGTAFFLLLMNLVLTVLIYKIVQEEEAYIYPGYIIFAYAGYTFYSFGLSVYHMVKYRRFHSPLLSAVKTVGFTTALVSILSLQAAMLTQFGTEHDFSHQIANGLTGLTICMAILLISVFMLVQARRMAKRSFSNQIGNNHKKEKGVGENDTYTCGRG